MKKMKCFIPFAACFSLCTAAYAANVAWDQNLNAAVNDRTACENETAVSQYHELRNQYAEALASYII